MCAGTWCRYPLQVAAVLVGIEYHHYLLELDAHTFFHGMFSSFVGLYTGTRCLKTVVHAKDVIQHLLDSTVSIQSINSVINVHLNTRLQWQWIVEFTAALDNLNLYQ